MTMWRRVKRSFGISAPRLSVRPHMPWYWRWGLAFPAMLAAIGLAWWAYGSGLELAGFHRSQSEQELIRLHEQVAKLEVENAELSKQIPQYERQIQIEQASNQETARQLKSLSDENLRLQEDLAFFQNLTAVRGKEGDLAIHRLKLERDQVPGEYRLKMLLVQSGQRAKDFVGHYQLVATVSENGIRTTRVFPQELSGNALFQLNFRYYQRVEQSIRLPAETHLESVQVRVFEQGATESRMRRNVIPS